VIPDRIRIVVGVPITKTARWSETGSSISAGKTIMPRVAPQYWSDSFVNGTGTFD
jgi:hypothetical protein